MGTRRVFEFNEEFTCRYCRWWRSGDGKRGMCRMNKVEIFTEIGLSRPVTTYARDSCRKFRVGSLPGKSGGRKGKRAKCKMKSAK